MISIDGGPAFPHLGLYNGIDGNMHPVATQYEGASLRDLFAGFALMGILAEGSTPGTPKQFAVEAFAQADAMLAARVKE